MLLTFDRVTKFYGPVIGVNDVTCRIGPGITALFGANGAGKSTLLKLASGQLRPNLGEVKIGERRAWSAAAKRVLGYSPDLNSFYEEMTGREFVYTLARLHGYSFGEARRRTADALDEVGMSDRADRKIAGFSHGMRQRIKLAQALVHSPELLLLDEPLNGIDIGGRREINHLLLGLAEQGRTILVSTHLLAEVEQLTDSLLMIARGRIVAAGTLSTIRGLLADRPFTVQIESPSARRLAGLLVDLEEVQSLEIDDELLTARVVQPPSFFAKVGELVRRHGLALARMESVDTGADAVFSYLEAR